MKKEKIFITIMGLMIIISGCKKEESKEEIVETVETETDMEMESPVQSVCQQETTTMNKVKETIGMVETVNHSEEFKETDTTQKVENIKQTEIFRETEAVRETKDVRTTEKVTEIQENSTTEVLRETETSEAKTSETGGEFVKEKTYSDWITYESGVRERTVTDGHYIIKGSGERITLFETKYTEVDGSNMTDVIAEGERLYDIYRDEVEEAVEYVNKLRSDANVAMLQISEKLIIASFARAAENAYSSDLSHIRPDGSSYATMIDVVNFKYGEENTHTKSAENLFCGSEKAQVAVRAWKNSSGHYENMIDEKYTKVGIGLAKGEKEMYWTMILTN